MLISLAVPLGWLVDQIPPVFNLEARGGRRAELRIFHPSKRWLSPGNIACRSQMTWKHSIWSDQMEMDLLDRIPGTKVIVGK